MSTKSKIHPTALVDEGVHIGEGTLIGAGAIVEKGAVIGARCEIRPHAVITGWVRMGDDNQIGYGAILGSEPQDMAFKPETESFVHIGNNNVIREYATLHRGTKPDSSTQIGDHNFLMVGAHLAHNVELGNHVTLVNNVLLAGYVQVADRAFLGGSVVVHQHTRIGALVMVRGQTRIGMDVPPYCMAVATNAVCGLNRVGMKRNGFTHQKRKAVEQAYDVLYQSGLNRTQALEKFNSEPSLQTPEVQAFAQFISQTKRGLCRALNADDPLIEGE